MKLWVVWGHDDIYGGLHGMKEIDIYEGTEQEAINYAYELADSVVSSYSQIYDILEDSVREYCEDEGIEMGIGSEEEDDIREEIYNDEDGFIEAYRLD